MFVLGFIEPLTWLVMVICGLVGFLFSGDSIKDAIPFIKDKTKGENNFLKHLDIVMGIIAFIWVTLLILDEEAHFRAITIFLFVIFMIVSFAHPLKELDGPALILLVIPFFVVAIAAYLAKDYIHKTFTIFGTSIELWVILTIVSLIMLIFLLIVFFVTETVVNPILYIVGWAPLIFIVCVLVIIQGVLLLLFPVNGIMHFL